MIISFSGPSGSGKTTIIENTVFQDYFEKQKISYFQEDKFFLLEIVKKVIGKNKSSKFKHRVIHQDGLDKGLKFYIMTFLYSCIIYIEYLAKYIYYEVLFPKKVLIMDRYIYDYLVTLNVNLGLSNRLLNWVFRNFPKPYLCFYVDVDLKTLQSRNKNLESSVVSTLNFQQEVLETYDLLSEQKNLINIKGDIEEDLISEEVAYHLENKRKLKKIGAVVIIGLDGSGKSTLCESLDMYLNELGIKSRLVHFYHDYILYKFLKKIGHYERKRSHLTEEDILEKSRQHNIKAKKEGRSFIWGFLHFSDSWVQYIFFKITNLGRFIIFDRYFYDFLVSFSFLRVPNIDLFEKFIPNVKNKFFLECPPELCYSRKPENTLEFFRESHNLYKKVAKKHNIKVIKSTKGKPEAALNNLLAEIEI